MLDGSDAAKAETGEQAGRTDPLVGKELRQEDMPYVGWVHMSEVAVDANGEMEGGAGNFAGFWEEGRQDVRVKVAQGDCIGYVAGLEAG